MRLYSIIWGGGALNAISSVLREGEMRQVSEGHVSMEADMAARLPGAGRGWDRSSRGTSGEGHGPANTSLKASRLQNLF